MVRILFRFNLHAVRFHAKRQFKYKLHKCTNNSFVGNIISWNASFCIFILIWCLVKYLWWKRACFTTSLGIFTRQVKMLFMHGGSMWGSFNPCKVRLKWTLEGFPNPSQMGDQIGEARWGSGQEGWGQMGEGDTWGQWGWGQMGVAPDEGTGWMGQMRAGARWARWRPYLGSHPPYLVPNSLSATPSLYLVPLPHYLVPILHIWYPIPLSGTPFPIWYPIPGGGVSPQLMSYQIGSYFKVFGESILLLDEKITLRRSVLIWMYGMYDLKFSMESKQGEIHLW